MTPRLPVNPMSCLQALTPVMFLAGTPGQPAYTSPMRSRLTPLSVLKLGRYLPLLCRLQQATPALRTPPTVAQAGQFGPGTSILLLGP